MGCRRMEEWRRGCHRASKGDAVKGALGDGGMWHFLECGTFVMHLSHSGRATNTQSG